MKPEFIPNNISFRMVSAKAKERYANSQAFALSQLQDQTTHKFSQTAIEILLLKYDMWFKWLLDCELTLRKEGTTSKTTRESLIYELNVIQREYIDIIKQNSQHFEPDFSGLWLKAHTSLYDMLKKSVLAYEANSITGLILHISDILTKVMDATLYELHEVDNIVNSENEPFVSVSDVCFDFIELFPERCMLTERLKLYEGARGKISVINLKRYTDEDIFPIVEKLTEAGYTINEVK